MSPFSAIISLKKSIIKNKAGSPIMPKLQESNDLNRDLDIELVLMKRKYEDLLLKHTSAVETIRILEDALKATALTANNNFLVSPKTNEDLDAEVEVQKKCKEEMKMQKEFHIDVENFKNKEETTIQLNASNIAPQPLVAQPFGLGYDSTLNYAVQPPSVVCSLCFHVMPEYSPQYYSGYKLRPTCNTCMKKDHLKVLESCPFSAFPSSEIPSSLVTHWIAPLKLSPSPINSSVSFRTHCVKWPNPGGALFTANEILQELKELWKKSNWET